MAETPPETAHEVTMEKGTAIVATPGHFAEWMEEHLAPHLAEYRSAAAGAEAKAGNASDAAKRVAAVVKEVAAVAAELAKAAGGETPLAVRAVAAAEEAARVAGLLAAL